jgi:hypothetical protein
MDSIWSMESLLSSGKNVGPYSPLVIDPKTGQPMIGIPETQDEKQAAAIASKVSPTKGPGLSDANPKAFVDQSTQMPVPEEMLGRDTVKWDKQKVLELLNREQSGVEQQAQALQDMRRTPQEVNWKPLASFVGTMVKGGDKLADAFPEVDTPEKRAMKIQQLENLLQNQRGDLSKNALGLLQHDLQAQAANRQNRFEQSQEKRLFDQARKEQNALVKEASDFKGSYKNVESALTPGPDGKVSVGRLQQSLSQFARLMGEKGVLTDTDTGRQLSPTLDLYMARLESMLTSDPNARLDASAVAAMADALKTAKQAYSDNYKMKADIFTEGYFQNPDSPYGGKKWSKKLVEDTYKPLESIQGVGDKKQAPQIPSGIMSPEEFFKQGKK